MKRPDAVAGRLCYVGEAWRDGPERVYAPMAEAIIARLPCLVGLSALDLGAGTGAAGVAMARAGARVTAVDIAFGMLAFDAEQRPPCVVGDARALPFFDCSFDVVLAAFSLNHLVDTTRGLTEARRVTRPGGYTIVAAYASEDDHPVKAAVATAMIELGWAPSPALTALRRRAMPRLATVELAAAELAAARLVGSVELRRVAIPELLPTDMIAWRTGMADFAPFVTGLSVADRKWLCRRALELLGPNPPTVIRSIILMTIAA